jgi:hypothetical protein
MNGFTESYIGWDAKPKILFKTKWLTIKETKAGFQFSERKGVNSVAVFLCRRKSYKWQVLIRMQPLCIDTTNTKIFPCPITGTVDNEGEILLPALNEIEEEGGYKVDKNKVKYLGEYIVGTQTNEICYMYFVDVSGMKVNKPKGDGSIFEKISKNVWKDIDYLKTCKYSACLIGYPLVKKEIKKIEDKLYREDNSW